MNKLLSRLMPKSRRGWIRIVESVFAVLLVFGFVMILASRNVQKPNVPESFYKTQHQILREVAQDYILRQAVLDRNSTPIKRFIDTRISPYPLNYSISICSSGESCPCGMGMCPTDKEVYADDIIISTDFEEYNPMKLTIFTWLQPGKEVSGEEIVCETCGERLFDCGAFTNNCGVYLSCGTCPAQATVTKCSADATQVIQTVTSCTCINNKKSLVDGTPTILENAPSCDKQSGVCSGSKKKCTGPAGSPAWPPCSDADYSTYNSNYYTLEYGFACGDGLDNDCDSSADSADTADCGKFVSSCSATSGSSKYEFIFENENCKPTSCGRIYSMLTSELARFKNDYYKKYCGEGDSCGFSSCTTIPAYGQSITTPAVGATKQVCLKTSGTNCKLKIKRTA